MHEMICEIKAKIEETEKVRMEMISQISDMQQRLSAKYVNKLRQNTERYEKTSVDDAVLEASQKLDALSMEYLTLESKLKKLKEKLRVLTENDQ